MVVRVTDKPLLRRRLARAHARAEPGADFLLKRVVADLAERLAGVERHFRSPSPSAARPESLREALAAERQGRSRLPPRADRRGLREAARRAPSPTRRRCRSRRASIDLFVSTLALQWTNDLPGALIQIRQALRPDGLFLAAMTGGRTLAELREALFAAETEIRGGASPRVLPAADVRDLGALLQRAGFALPVVDRDVAHGPLRLRLRAVRGPARDGRDERARRARRAGRRRGGSSCAPAEIYAERFSDPDGRVRATFEIVSLSGWAPHESQQQPARRGSGQVSLAEVLGSGKPPSDSSSVVAAAAAADRGDDLR